MKTNRFLPRPGLRSGCFVKVFHQVNEAYAKRHPFGLSGYRTAACVSSNFSVEWLGLQGTGICRCFVLEVLAFVLSLLLLDCCSFQESFVQKLFDIMTSLDINRSNVSENIVRRS